MYTPGSGLRKRHFHPRPGFLSTLLRLACFLKVFLALAEARFLKFLPGCEPMRSRFTRAWVTSTPWPALRAPASAPQAKFSDIMRLQNEHFLYVFDSTVCIFFSVSTEVFELKFSYFKYFLRPGFLSTWRDLVFLTPGFLNPEPVVYCTVRPVLEYCTVH